MKRKLSLVLLTVFGLSMAMLMSFQNCSSPKQPSDDGYDKQSTGIESCTYEYVGPSPLGVGETGKEIIVCENLAAGAIVKIIGTKDGNPQPERTATLVNGRYENTVTNNVGGLGGNYSWHVEVFSQNGQWLLSTTSVSLTIIEATMAACTYTVVGTNPLPLNETVVETVTCTDVPSDAIVKIVGTKDGALQIDAQVTLVNGQFQSSTVNSGGLTGVYVRHVEVISSGGVTLVKTPTRSLSVQ